MDYKAEILKKREELKKLEVQKEIVRANQQAEFDAEIVILTVDLSNYFEKQLVEAYAKDSKSIIYLKDWYMYEKDRQSHRPVIIHRRTIDIGFPDKEEIITLEKTHRGITDVREGLDLKNIHGAYPKIVTAEDIGLHLEEKSKGVIQFDADLPALFFNKEKIGL